MLNYNNSVGGFSMLKMNNKQCFLLSILLTILLITGCEEEVEEDKIIGTWITSSFEKYENIDCTGTLVLTELPLAYNEKYIFTEDSFTWSISLNNGSNTTEGGSYTFIDSVYTLSGTGSVHGSRFGKLVSETSMTIKLQMDNDGDAEKLIDTCYKLTFDKID